MPSLGLALGLCTTTGNSRVAVKVRGHLVTASDDTLADDAGNQLVYAQARATSTGNLLTSAGDTLTDGSGNQFIFLRI